MASLHISDAAYAAGELAAVTYVAESDALDAASDVLHGSAHLIVADELRRLAALLSETDDARLLVARADELTGGASA